MSNTEHTDVGGSSEWTEQMLEVEVGSSINAKNPHILHGEFILTAENLTNMTRDDVFICMTGRFAPAND